MYFRAVESTILDTMFVNSRKSGVLSFELQLLRRMYDSGRRIEKPRRAREHIGMEHSRAPRENFLQFIYII